MVSLVTPLSSTLTKTWARISMVRKEKEKARSTVHRPTQLRAVLAECWDTFDQTKVLK